VEGKSLELVDHYRSTCTIHFDRWLAFYSGYLIPEMILGEPFVISARPISF